MLARLRNLNQSSIGDRAAIARSHANLVLKSNRNRRIPVNSAPHIREACSHDARHLAKLFDIAGEGIPNWLWAKCSNAYKTALDIGAEQVVSGTFGFSFTNALVVECHDQIAGMISSHAVDKAYDQYPDYLPAPLLPFMELEKQASGTWHINGLSLFAEYRGRGLGTLLVSRVEQLARASGYSRISIPVYAQNSAALKLCKRLGYHLSISTPVRWHPCQPYYTGNMLLLVKELGNRKAR